jgi:hypothetical protein
LFFTNVANGTDWLLSVNDGAGTLMAPNGSSPENKPSQSWQIKTGDVINDSVYSNVLVCICILPYPIRIFNKSIGYADEYCFSYVVLTIKHSREYSYLYAVLFTIICNSSRPVIRCIGWYWCRCCGSSHYSRCFSYFLLPPKKESEGARTAIADFQ